MRTYTCNGRGDIAAAAAARRARQPMTSMHQQSPRAIGVTARNLRSTPEIRRVAATADETGAKSIRRLRRRTAVVTTPTCTTPAVIRSSGDVNRSHSATNTLIRPPARPTVYPEDNASHRSQRRDAASTSTSPTIAAPEINNNITCTCHRVCHRFLSVEK